MHSVHVSLASCCYSDSDLQAVERSRLRIAAAQQRSQRSQQSPQCVNLTTPVQAEQDIPHCTEAKDSLVVASGSGSTQIAASPAPSLARDNFKVFSSPSESSLKTPSRPIDPALADLMEKKLSSSIKQIEKMVRKNLKRTPKVAQPSKRAIQRRTLMSMRWVEYCTTQLGEQKVHLRLVLIPSCLLLS